MKKLNKVTYKIYRQHAWKYKYTLSGIIFSIIIASALNMYSPILYKDFFDVLTENNGDAASKLIDIIIKIFAVNTTGFIIWRIAAFLNIRFQALSAGDLAKSSFDYLQKHSIGFFHNHFVGSLVKKVNRFHNSFRRIGNLLMWDAAPIILKMGIVVVVLWMHHMYFGLAVLAWLIVFFVANYAFSIYKLKYDFERSKLESKATGVLADSITNHNNVELFSAHKNEYTRFSHAIDEVMRISRFAWTIGEYFQGAQIFFMTVLEFGIFYLAINFWQQGLISVGDFVLLQTYLFVVFLHLWDVGRSIRDYYEYMADAGEMAEIFDAPHEIVDVKRAKTLEVKKGKIEFQNVDFRYNKTRKIFSKLNLKIKAGERMAFVGHSGAGKSTIIKVLLRIHDLTGGKILIDGQRVSHATLESLRNNISYVPQESILFHRSLMENIRYGKPKATDEEVIKAAKLAHCDEFISQFPEGYDTFVGERGVKLSGGERQRVAIARAILKNAPILVLDEATSSLDSESEMLIQQGLDVLMKGKTVIVIAHRLSTIMKMDRIIVMEDGEVLEKGSHKELLKKKSGTYKKLWELQAGGFL
jgi:ATP-binding cassette, subfamily B, bacterial